MSMDLSHPTVLILIGLLVLIVAGGVVVYGMQRKKTRSFELRKPRRGQTDRGQGVGGGQGPRRRPPGPRGKANPPPAPHRAA